MNNIQTNPNSFNGPITVVKENELQMIQQLLRFLEIQTSINMISNTGSISSGDIIKNVVGNAFLPRLNNSEFMSGYEANENKTKIKTCFLVFKNQKYITIKVKDIAFFYIGAKGVTIVGLDRKEYHLNKSLDQVSASVSSEDFFRVNRRYLVHFKAIREVEHYFLRKLFVRLAIETPEQLLINKEKAPSFLSWMENR